MQICAQSKGEQGEEREPESGGSKEAVPVDQYRVWEAIAQAEFGADGLTEGWDSDTEEYETPEQKYMKVGFS